MTHLELDLNKIAQIAKQKENENFKFRSFLKNQDSKKIDKIVHRLNEEISSQINCQDCGNCCIALEPCLNKSEIKNLAQIKNLSQTDFEAQFVEIDKFEDIKFLKGMPCIFLKDKSCSIYQDRPANCKSFPHTHKAKFTSRTMGVINNYEICPIVFNLLEKLKLEVGFKKH